MTTKFTSVPSYINFINALPKNIVYLSLLEKPKKPHEYALSDEVANGSEYKIATYTSIGLFVFKQPIDKMSFAKTYKQIKTKLRPKLVDSIDFDGDSLTIGNFVD